MGTAAYRRREFLYLLLIGTQKRMLSICTGRRRDGLRQFCRIPLVSRHARVGRFDTWVKVDPSRRVVVFWEQLDYETGTATFGVMKARTQTASPFWRWALIVSESLLATYAVAMHFAGRHARQETGLFLVVGVLVFVAWVFLFFGSPFLVSSQRWLAILGWSIAASAILFPVL